jgi:hypothetical protein
MVFIIFVLLGFVSSVCSFFYYSVGAMGILFLRFALVISFTPAGGVRGSLVLRFALFFLLLLRRGERLTRRAVTFFFWQKKKLTKEKLPKIGDGLDARASGLCFARPNALA